ncbi:tetratricopeptide repeat protein [Paracoccus aestuariivivens]|uniref:Uncharacterized protein n=1 Tax=Paracoccus aestuariivivens TaxID=1820333 RepID=A0A6L6JA85_9RHOB|nr:hypothetical protein [Paracoccus aestuariivivens]MTH79002.1 hypothetical protein [Paracoccus aestuariivivens]
MTGPDVLFDGEHVQLLHFRRDSRIGLLTFDIMHARANGRNAFGKKLCERIGYDLLAVVPKYPCWYPAEEMRRIASISGQIGGATRIAYGASMGGYGALRWGRQMGAEVVLACSPQYSIDPKAIGDGDRRYARHFRPDVHLDMDIRPEHIPTGSVMIYDPCFRLDRIHADRMLFPSVTGIPLPHMGHRTVECLAGSVLATSVFEGLIAGRISAIRKVLLERRKITHSFPIHLAQAALQRGKLELADRIAQKVIEPWSRHRLLAQIAGKRQNYSGAADHFRSALLVRPECRLTRLQLGKLGQPSLLGHEDIAREAPAKTRQGTP